ncbi:BRO family protein [Pseudomonas asiatica]|uniref:BRO-N domain-containing protein n=1 Tax=Pseudomonas asiatica TaxID=2219225 RepID=UPI0025A198EC|nr:BRO family protein [Pseudomonas asiatica]WJM52458.1 BRO family protein [Pseudomonas asiatica]
MGIELDVLAGHPEHDLLFVATQVARAAGLKHPAESIRNARQGFGAGHPLSTLIQENCISLPTDIHGRRLRSNTVIFTESELYAMLLRGHAPQSEPFRRWVTEEVLPTIRKTGQYNAAESSDPIALGIMDELKLLRGEFSRVTGELVELKGRTKSPPLTSQGLPKG